MHHKKVKAREFQIGNLVLKHIIRSTKEKNTRKLGANLEGPCTVVAKRGKSSYTLVYQDGKILDKQWNSFHLKRIMCKLLIYSMK